MTTIYTAPIPTIRTLAVRRKGRDAVNLYATYRIETGTVAGCGLIVDRETGRCIWSCRQAGHHHPYRRKGRRAGVRAQECADKQLCRILRGRSAGDGGTRK